MLPARCAAILQVLNCYQLYSEFEWSRGNLLTRHLRKGIRLLQKYCEEYSLLIHQLRREESGVGNLARRWKLFSLNQDKCARTASLDQRYSRRQKPVRNSQSLAVLTWYYSWSSLAWAAQHIPRMAFVLSLYRGSLEEGYWKPSAVSLTDPFLQTLNMHTEAPLKVTPL